MGACFFKNRFMYFVVESYWNPIIFLDNSIYITRQSSGLFGLSSGQHGRLMNKRSRVRFLSLKRVIFPPCPFYANLTFPGRPWNGNPSEWTRAAPTFESPSPSSWSAPSSSWSAPSSSWSAPSNSWSAPSSSWSAQTYGGNGGGKEHS